jgi:4-hydroxybenzoate polyprenyltransferase
MRPRQWVKNAFVAAPLFFTPEALNATGIFETAMAVLVFCLLSSAVYVVNDYCDREADRLHPEKRRRPIASGEVSAPAAVVLAGLLLAGAAAISLTQLPMDFAPLALTYFILNVLYSLKLKHVAILDVLIVASGFVLRVAAGVLRYLQITLVEERSGSPTEIALTDKFLILSVLGWAAVFAAIMYL